MINADCSPRRLLLITLAVGGCKIDLMLPDNDHDGSNKAFDCDENNPRVYPGAPEVCGDGVINDCDKRDDPEAALAACAIQTVEDDCVTIDGFNAPIAHSVKTAGDLNGDGHTDLYVLTAAPDSNDVMQSATAHFFLGPFTEDVSLDDAVWRVHVPTSGATDLRLFVSRAGDLLGEDGREEVFVTVHDDNYCEESTCAVYVLGLADRPLDGIDTFADNAKLSFSSEGSISPMGAVPADYDGDGALDVVLGQQTANVNPDPHRFFLFRGPFSTAARTSSGADIEYSSVQPDSGMGYNAATIGDQDGDGLPELLLAAPLYPIGAHDDVGAAFIVPGLGTGKIKVESVALGALYAEDPDSATCRPAGSAVDLNEDGLEDLFCASPFNHLGADRAGGTYVAFGSSLGWGDRDLAQSDLYFQGEDAFDYAGREFFPLGDFNGDGHPDALHVARDRAAGGLEWSGQAYITLGPFSARSGRVYDLGQAEVQILGPEVNSQLGRWGVNVDDLNGDGKPDFLLSSWRESEGRGYGHIFCGGSIY